MSGKTFPGLLFFKPGRGLAWRLATVLLLALGLLPVQFGSTQESQEPELPLWASMPATGSGQTVAFATNAALMEADSNKTSDIYVYERGSGAYERISLSSSRAQTKGASFQPGISMDGRLVVFASLGDDLSASFQPADDNHLSDVFLHDRESKVTQRISYVPGGAAPQGWSDQPSITPDGRYIAYASSAGDILQADEDDLTDIYLYDHVDSDTLLASPSSPGSAASPAVSADSRYVAYRDQAGEQAQIWLFDRVTNTALPLPGSALPATRPLSGPAISADGRYLAWASGGSSAVDVFLYSRLEDQVRPLPDPLPVVHYRGQPATPSLSADGRFLALALESAVYIYDRESNRWKQAASSASAAALSLDAGALAYTPSAGLGSSLSVVARPAGGLANPFFSGWIINGPGMPFPNIPIAASGIGGVVTQADGSFAIPSASGSIELRPQLKGFTFSPKTRTVAAVPGGSYALTFSALPEGVLEAARADLGMPYGLNRGCVKNDEPCGGPFSGFHQGDCTDLVMDGYRNGIAFDIQAALAQDARSHPEHYYRWQDARNAYDMWRFFAYTQRLLPPSAGYHPGDIVFFDWEHDGVIDHVALVSETGRGGSARMLLDATGVIPENPSGLAAELEWQVYHTRAAAGHTRWLGNALPAPAEPQPGAYLNVALDSPLAHAVLVDDQGRRLSALQKDLPGGGYLSTGQGEVLTIRLSAPASLALTIEISSAVAAQVQLGLQTVQNGLPVWVEPVSLALEPGETLRVPVSLSDQGGRLVAQWTLPGP